MTDNTSKYKELFCTEAEDNLATLSRLLLEIENDPHDLERYKTLMRSAHTIKGSSATMGYNELAKLAHALEDLFHAGERGSVVLGHEAVSVALSALDRMNASLSSIKEYDSEIATGAYVEHVLATLAASGAPQGVVEHVSETRTSASTPTEKDFSYTAPSNIRVDVEHLNVLMGLFEEMLMIRLKLDTILVPALDFNKTITDPLVKEKMYFLDEFKTLFGELARSLSETQSELLRIRLVALEQLFGQFPRMVRDLSLQEDKKIAFEVSGAEVALDRTVLDGLGGALAHLLRNAVDHGILKEGVIRLDAERVNDRVHVIVEDDGVGVDYERVRAVAIKRGLLNPEDGANLRKTEIAELLFHQNLSTSEKVTEVSGRGVGLAAVKAFTQEVGGKVSVVSPTSEHGGTRFVLDLPVSLATVLVLLVESSGFTFALPFTSVIRTINFKRGDIVSSAHQESLVVEGKPVPLLRLSALLGINFAEMFHAPKVDIADEVIAVLLMEEGERILLMVDRCVGEQELLVKSLPPLLRDVKGFSGSTLLPDGRTILLLDTQGLLAQAFKDILETHSDAS